MRFKPVIAVVGFMIIMALGAIGLISKKKDDEPFRPVIHQTGPAPIVTPDTLP